MSKSASDIVDRALSLIDEVPTSFTTAATTETSIREQALEILPEVCRDLVKELPWELKRYLASDTHIVEFDSLDTGENQNNYTKKKLVLLPPSDFWEFISIKLTVWAKPVTKYIYIGSEEYSKQNNPFTRAGIQNPVVALSEYRGSIDQIRIECFSYEGSLPAVNLFNYVSFNNVPDDVGNSWPDELFDEVTKALATELHIIKSRIDEAVIKGEEVTNAMDQHK